MSIYSSIQVNNVKITYTFLTGRNVYEGRSATQMKKAGVGEEDHLGEKTVKHSLRQTFVLRLSVDRNTDQFGQTSGWQYSNFTGSKSRQLNATR